MAKVYFALLAAIIIFGTYATIDFRNKMSSSRLGSDVSYVLDAQGDAAVEMVNKSYFTSDETQKNFDSMATRLGTPDVDAFRKGVEESLGSIAEKSGRQFAFSDFSGSFERRPDYGAQTYRFKWTGFAEKRDSSWVVDFASAKPMKMTKDSVLRIVLPQGASLVKSEPSPSGGDGKGTLEWTGTGEMPWPYVEYRR